MDEDLTLNILSVPVSKKLKKIHAEKDKIRKPINEYDSGLDYITDDFSSNSEPLHGKNKKSQSPHKRERPVGSFNKQKNFHNERGHGSQSDSQKEGEQQNRSYMPKDQVISSLFKSNPEIPHVPISNVKANKEMLFSKKSFKNLDLHPHLVSCLESRFSITTLTEVQEKTIPVLLNGKDALVKSCTGSGKTLAYAVPIVQKLQEKEPKIQRSSGTFALVILPTRELALQSYECFSTLTKAFTRIVPGYLTGGEKKKSEKARIRKGINILITTPGRLLDHLDHTGNLNLDKIEWLIIDEGDKLLEEGFENAVVKIIQHCNLTSKTSVRQTALLSATLSREVEKLAGISMKDPVCIDISSADKNISKMEDLTVPDKLKQYFVVVPTKLRLVTLAAFIIDKCMQGNMKAIIFLASQCSVDFHFTLFNDILTPLMAAHEHSIKVFKLHGNMKQEDRSEIFNKFRNSDDGILFCTDVAARGLHLPHVDWIVQYNVPTSVEVYVHRVGRTARIGEEGRSLLFLMPSEVKFMDLLQQHKLQLTEMNMRDIICSLAWIEESSNRKKQHCPSKAAEIYATNLQAKFENHVYSEEAIHNIAKEAFVSDVQAYASYPKQLRPIIPFKLLHLGHVAKSFCLREAPSQLGCKFAKPPVSAKRPGKQIRMAQKRKYISEYDSGLDAWKSEKSNPRKKFKRHK